MVKCCLAHQYLNLLGKEGSMTVPKDYGKGENNDE